MTEPHLQTQPFQLDKMTSIETYMYGLKKRAQEHHCIVHGTFPVDLTAIAALRKRYSRAVRPVTLLPFFIKAVALSVRSTPNANRILFRRFPFGRRIARFSAIDVNVPITRMVDGELMTFIGTLRNVDGMTIGQIQDALEQMQRGDPAASPYIEKLRKLKRAPPFVALLFHWLMTRSPAFYLKNAGTCSLTTLDGMRGEQMFALGPSTSVFGIGGIGDEPVVRDGQVVVRRMLRASIALDNYVLSGGDGLALARAFQTLLESASFVHDELAHATSDVTNDNAGAA